MTKETTQANQAEKETTPWEVVKRMLINTIDANTTNEEVPRTLSQLMGLPKNGADSKQDEEAFDEKVLEIIKNTETKTEELKQLLELCDSLAQFIFFYSAVIATRTSREVKHEIMAKSLTGLLGR